MRVNMGTYAPSASYVAQHHRHMGGVGNQREDRVGHRHQRLFQARARADALLRAIEGGEAARVLLDPGRDASEIFDLAYGDDARFLAIVVYGHGDGGDCIAGAELDDVTAFERGFVTRSFAEDGAGRTANQRRAVGRAQIFQHGSGWTEHDARVFCRDLDVLDDEVIGRRAADANDLARRVE